jgi:branched-subunit amino acid ABC-type transport system permease component
MTVTAILLGVVTGCALASIYVLIAISFTLVLAASGVFNFAQGTIVMGGTVLAFLLAVKLGWPVPMTISAIATAGLVAGLLTHVIAVWPAIGRSRSFTHTTVLATIGLATAVNAVVALLFGSDSHRVPSYVSDDPILMLSVPLRPIYLLIVVIGASGTLAIEWLMRGTELGRMFRATLEDPEGARLLGIDTRRIVAFAFALAGAMSALAGYLIAPVIAASAFTAQELAFYGFAGMAIGGFGSFAGALAGGAIVGLLSGVIPAIANPHWALPAIWIVVVAILLVKPAGLRGTGGLFGSARIREV